MIFQLRFSERKRQSCQQMSQKQLYNHMQNIKREKQENEKQKWLKKRIYPYFIPYTKINMDPRLKCKLKP